MEKTIKENTVRKMKCGSEITYKVKNNLTREKEYLQRDALIKLAAVYKRNGIAGRATMNDLKLYFRIEDKRSKTERKIILHEKGK